MIPDEIMKDFYRKLLIKLEDINITLSETVESVDQLNDTLQKFGNYMGEKDGGIEVRNDLIK